MIDSVLKGTGNSRFLKSAVPAGTSWADALAMLQAGTFPIDFNGINTEGFQQVGTPLNKANLLKDATAAQIGLPPSTTPDGMFQALGNTGELHVWRKTVVVGSYYIGATQGNYGCICRNTGSASFGVKIQYASEITVDSHENRNLVSPSDMTIIANNSGITSPSATSVANTLRGKFIRLAGIPDGYQNSELKYAVGSVFYCPESISCFVKDVFSDGNYYICLDGIKNVPTKTENVVTYPVSTNPKAYQEGDDAKAAGYVVGEVKTGSFHLEYDNNGSHPLVFCAASSPNVTDDGVVSVPTTTTLTIYSGNEETLRNNIKGKFLQKEPNNYVNSDFGDGVVFYVPEDVKILKFSWDQILIDRYQPVTGYAAIPAGTTIEYLGKLGDKARVQVLSYVGTGTYGSSNPNSLTFDFAPKVILIYRPAKNYNDYYHNCMFLFNGVNTGITLAYGSGFNNVTWNNKKVSWYSDGASEKQMSVSGQKYYAAAIG